MVVGDPDCCARKTCGHGEIWHPTCCFGSRRHFFKAPLLLSGKIILIGDRFWYDFESNPDFPQDPAGWIECTFSDIDGPNLIVIKPRGYEKFVINRNATKRMSLINPKDVPDGNYGLG